MIDKVKLASKRLSAYPTWLIDRLLNIVSRHNGFVLLLTVSCGVAMIGAFVIRDLTAADAEAQEM